MSDDLQTAVFLELLGFDAPALEQLASLLELRGIPWRHYEQKPERRLDPDACDELLGERIHRGEAILVVGDQLAPREAAALVARVLPQPESPQGTGLQGTGLKGTGLGGTVVVLAAGGQTQLFEPFVAADAIFYLSNALPPLPDVADLLAAAYAAYRAEPRNVEVPGVEVDELLAEIERQTAASAIAGRVAKEIETLLDAESAFVWFFDRERDLFWRPAAWTAKEEIRRESAAAGLIGFVGRTSQTLAVERISADPRFDAEADNDHGPRNQRFLAASVHDPDREASCQGVLVALRPAVRPAFTETESQRLDYLAGRLCRTFEQMIERIDRDRKQQVVSEQAAAIFRREALEHYSKAVDLNGRTLEISPAWMRRSIWLLAAAALAALCFSLLGRVEESIGAPAVIRLSAGEARVLSFLPARHRPLLEKDMPLRFDLDGFGEVESSTIESISGVLTPSEARQRIGPRFAETVEINGAVTLIEARLSSLSFRRGARRFELYDGLPGRVEIVIDSRPILLSLLPAGK